MAYATPEELAELCGSLEAADQLERASDEVDALCYGRIRKAGPFQREKIKKATCYHAAFLYAYGEELQSPLASYGINGVSMSFDSSRTASQGSITTNNATMAQLRQSGLASRLIP